MVWGPGTQSGGARRVWHLKALMSSSTRALRPGEAGHARGLPLRSLRRLLAERLSPELRQQAVEDPVTGAFNKRADEAATARAFAERRPGTRLVRLRADLDNFKAVNDAFGHAAGDRALCVVYGALERATRDVDVISLARPGGDEFALTLRLATDADPNAIRDRIEDSVNRALIRAGFGGAGGRRIGMSMGVALETGSATPEALDTAADAAAQERKRVRRVSGRRRPIRRQQGGRTRAGPAA